MNRRRQWLTSLASLDRRWLYIVLALAVAIAMLTGLRFADSPSFLVQPVYDEIERLPAGSVLILSCEYTPSSAPELEPMAFAITRHALLTGHRICFMSLWPEGSNQIGRIVTEVVEREFPTRREGIDWVNLGFKAGDEKVINALARDFGAVFDTDFAGRSVSDLPVLAGIGSLADFSLVVAFSAGTPGLKEWILFAGDHLHLRIAGGCNGAGTTQFLPYFPQQLLGLLGGLKGAAEYEAALARGHPEFRQRTRTATDGMGPQAVAHCVILLFIVLGNLGQLVGRRGAGGDSR